MGGLATSPLPSRGVPNTSKRGAKSEVANKRADWLHHPYRLGGSPKFQSAGQNENWPPRGRIEDITGAI